MKFTKMHGLGNDYVFVDCMTERVENAPEVARAMSDRHRGVGADGLILICPSDAADVRMEMYNADGSRAQMCGNGLRCLAKYAFEHGLATRNPMQVETDAGIRLADLAIENGTVGLVSVDLGQPALHPRSRPSTIGIERIVEHRLRVGESTFTITCVSMGNPHAVAFVDDLDAVDLVAAGGAIEHAPEFPERINAHFVRVDNPGHVTMKTWERGSGATRACGTGACAVCVAGVITGRAKREITATLPGGDLEVVWADDDHVHLTGPAEEVFSGQWPGRLRIAD
jgi:diaminopimelate epimerase